MSRARCLRSLPFRIAMARTFVATLVATFGAMSVPATNAHASTLAIHQNALTTVIVKRLFADSGRRVLSGAIGSCNYAYLERPAVTLRDGRLFLRMHLVAQAGIVVGGQCRGAGDSFMTTISGQPYVSADGLSIRDFRLEEGRDVYKGLLDPLLRRQVPALLGVNVRDELTRGLQNQAPDFRFSVAQLAMQEATARDGYLTIRFDLALVANDAKSAP